MPTPLEQLGPRLRLARQKAFLTVRETADQIGVGHTAIVRYENGDIAPPLDRLIALSNLYQVSLAGLLVADDSLLPLLTLLERATTTQIRLYTKLLQQAIEESAAQE